MLMLVSLLSPVRPCWHKYCINVSISVRLSANQRVLYAHVNDVLTEYKHKHKHKHKMKAYAYVKVAAVLTCLCLLGKLGPALIDIGPPQMAFRISDT